MKRPLEIKYKAFLVNFKGISDAKNCLRHESVTLKLRGMTVNYLLIFT